MSIETEKIFDRYVQSIYPSREKALNLLESGKRSFYLGIDATGPDIHIGHATNLLWLKQLKKLGHHIIILVGDFTARIGDPTGKDVARRALTEEEVRENQEAFLSQIEKILPRGSFEVRHNSEWLKGMTFEDIIRVASNFTVQQMIVRDMFQRRIKEEKPIYLHEFFYPLMQGYDSVAMEVDGEVGGDDQTFNMLVGRDLSQALLKKEKLVVTTKLLEDPETSKKIMNKSEGNVISLRDDPQEIRRKILSLDDRLTRTVFELCTEKELVWIEEKSQGNPREFKEALADELVRMLYGEESISEARKPESVKGGLPLGQALKIWGATTSISAAKDIITGGGVRINGKVEKDWNGELKPGDKVQVGKGKFYEVE